MAETLTVNTEEQSQDLTPEEQDSLQVGEEMAKEQGELLAGKYKNAEDLEKAYVELQKKLGDQDDVQEGKETQEVKDESETDEPEAESNPAVSLLTEANNEYYENGNQLKPETLERFKEMSSSDLVNAYLELQKNNPEANKQEADMADSQINKIQNSVGGENEYKKLMNWAGQNLEKNEIDAFDSLINTGNVDAIQLGVTALKSKYENANGYEGRMLTGKAAKAEDVFRSQAQLVEAMSDPRYDRDPAYRQDVVARLERSDIDF
jgi:hypothetical protein